MALKPIEIFIDTISSVAHRINISSVVSLGSNQYRLNTNNTLYLRPLKKVLIDGVEYVVDDFQINSYITVSATDGSDTPVTLDFFDIDVPLFLFGNPKMVSAELIKRINNGNGSWPYIWLVEISNTSGTLDPAAAVTQTPSFNLFFLDSNDYENWSIQQHYDNDIYVMSNYINFVLSILKSRRDVYETDSITYTTTNHVNFGDYIVDEGMNERILNDNVTGVQLQVDLPIIIQTCSDVTITANCPIITETFNSVSISSPLSFKNIVVQTDEAIPVETGTVLIDTAESLVIQVASAGATSLDIDINGFNYVSGVSTNQDIPVLDTGSNPIGTVVPGVDVVIGDVTQTINGNPIANNKAETSKSITIEYANGDPVSVVTITDDESTFLGTVPTPPSIITTNVLNTGQETAFLSGDDGDRYLNGDYAAQNVADITDFYTLTEVNEWGHLKRFTGDTGGYMDEATGSFFDVNNVATTKALAFPNDIMRDYCWRRRWYFARSAARTWQDCVTLTLTEVRGGEDGWFCPNKSEYDSVSSANSKSVEYIDSRLFNWAAQNMWCSTTDKILTTNSFRFNGTFDSWSKELKTQTNANAYVKLF